ncbi:MAG: hypothetical protein J6C19_04985 [Lachnospiraceae bacterium]|nr:hypothetical protein [Lachnospiraceae bacterium]
MRSLSKRLFLIRKKLIIPHIYGIFLLLYTVNCPQNVRFNVRTQSDNAALPKFSTEKAAFPALHALQFGIVKEKIIIASPTPGLPTLNTFFKSFKEPIHLNVSFCRLCSDSSYIGVFTFSGAFYSAFLLNFI